MSVFNELVGQDDVITQLKHALHSPGAMTHAWLFTGPRAPVVPMRRELSPRRSSPAVKSPMMSLHGYSKAITNR